MTDVARFWWWLLCVPWVPLDQLACDSLVAGVLVASSRLVSSWSIGGLLD